MTPFAPSLRGSAVTLIVDVVRLAVEFEAELPRAAVNTAARPLTRAAFEVVSAPVDPSENFSAVAARARWVDVSNGDDKLKITLHMTIKYEGFA